MKIADIINEAGGHKSQEWQEGVDAFYRGEHHQTCPYEDEERKGQWINGWQAASRGDDD